jgi:hypothetical protein
LSARFCRANELHAKSRNACGNMPSHDARASRRPSRHPSFATRTRSQMRDGMTVSWRDMPPATACGHSRVRAKAHVALDPRLRGPAVRQRWSTTRRPHSRRGHQVVARPRPGPAVRLDDGAQGAHPGRRRRCPTDTSPLQMRSPTTTIGPPSRVSSTLRRRHGARRAGRGAIRGANWSQLACLRPSRDADHATKVPGQSESQHGKGFS